MINKKHIKYFQKTILDWYSQYGREFPWRKKSCTNYELIIAEVLLQRTKAETIAHIMPKFIKKYPSWKILEKASLDELREDFRPIGLFNQRSRRVFKLAKEMAARRGRFPKERDQVEEIPMMGQYITNAYELYVLKKNSPLLDVNMARVLERFFGPRKLSDIRYDPYLQNLASQVVECEDPKSINWAILDYAALICKPRRPLCEFCVVREKCKYYEQTIPS